MWMLRVKYASSTQAATMFSLNNYVAAGCLVVQVDTNLGHGEANQRGPASIDTLAVVLVVVVRICGDGRPPQVLLVSFETFNQLLN